MTDLLDRPLESNDNALMALSLSGGPLMGSAVLLGMLSLSRFREQFRLDTPEPAVAKTGRLRPSLPAAAQLVDRVRVAREHRAQYRRLCEVLAMRPEIPAHKAPEILAEVERHRWIEAEKAGHDIWSAQNPSDPASVAVRDWFFKHYHTWRSSHCERAMS